jgi:hypothetical protein
MDWTDKLKKIEGLSRAIQKLAEPPLDTETTKKLYRSLKALGPPAGLESVSKIALWIVQGQFFEYLKRISEITETFTVYSKVVAEVYKLYTDPDKRRDYVKEIAERCPKTFSNIYFSKSDYADYILLLTTKRLLESPVGYMPRDTRELFDTIRRYVIYRVSLLFRTLEQIPIKQASLEEYTEGGLEEQLGTSQSIKETFLKKEEATEFLNQVSEKLEILMGYLSESPPEDKEGWVRYILGLDKKRAFGDRRREDRATKRMQRRLKNEYELFSQVVTEVRGAIADVRALVEIGVLEKELVLATLSQRLIKSNVVD